MCTFFPIAPFIFPCIDAPRSMLHCNIIQTVVNDSNALLFIYVVLLPFRKENKFSNQAMNTDFFVRSFLDLILKEKKIPKEKKRPDRRNEHFNFSNNFFILFWFSHWMHVIFKPNSMNLIRICDKIPRITLNIVNGIHCTNCYIELLQHLRSFLSLSGI